MEDIKSVRINSNELWNYFSDDKIEPDNLLIENGTVRIKTEEIYVFEKNVIQGISYNIDTIIDIAVDECNNFYLLSIIIDKDNKKRNAILFYNTTSNDVVELKCIQLDNPTSIGVDEDTIYITNITKQIEMTGSVIAFAKSNLQIRWILDSYKEKPLIDPKNITVLQDGIYILEGSDITTRICKVDRKGTIVALSDDDKLADALDMKVAVLNEEIYIYVLKDSTIYIYKEIKDIDLKIIFVRQILLQGSDLPAAVMGLAINSKGHIFVGEPYIQNENEDKKTIHRIITDNDGIITNITSLWTYRGSTFKLITDSSQNLYAVNIIDPPNSCRVTFLRNSTITKKDKLGLYQGTYVSKAINSNSDYTLWHELIVEGEFNEGLFVDFYYHISSDENIDISTITWQKALLQNPSSDGWNKINALFENIDTDSIEKRRKYLRFKMILLGNEIESPIIHFLTIVFPISVYLEYLPAFYHDDKRNYLFLEKFFSIFKSFFSQIDYTIEHLTKYLDPYGIPDDFLSWFGSWLSIGANENWPTEKRRAFISKAVLFYKKRGTRQGIEEMINFYIEGPLVKNCNDKPYIVEHFKLDTIDELDENKVLDTIDRVELFIDDIKIGEENKGHNDIYTIPWDTYNFCNGRHRITAIAYDNKGNCGVNNNTEIEILNDIIKVISPSEGEKLTGKHMIKAHVLESIDVDKVEFYIDEIKLGESNQPDDNEIYTIELYTSDYLNGRHYILVKVYDTDNHAHTDYIPVYFLNNQTAPDVHIISPTDDEKLRNKIDIKAYATDDLGVVNVEFYINSIKLGSKDKPDANGIYAIELNTSDYTNGIHYIIVKAYDENANASVDFKRIQILNDNTAPVINIISPYNGEEVKERVPIQIYSVDNTGIAKVEFYVDDVKIGEKNHSGNDIYILGWNSRFVNNGIHHITTQAFDTYNNINIKDISITVVNDNTLPMIDFISPLDGEEVDDKVILRAYAVDDTGIDKVEFYINNMKLGDGSKSDNFYWIEWNTTELHNDIYQLYAKAYNNSGQVSIDSILVSVLNAPRVTIVSPINGNMACGSIDIDVNAIDKVDIVKYELYIDDNKIDEKNQPVNNKYIMKWNTLNYSNDNHHIMIKAYNIKGNIGIDRITVFVLNDSTAPVLQVISPYNEEVVKGRINIKVHALSNKLNALFTPPRKTGTISCKKDNTENKFLVSYLYGTERSYFSVFIKESIIQGVGLTILKKIIEEQKPAHMGFFLNIIRPWFYLDYHTYLALNTALSKPSSILGDRFVIGTDIMLDDFEKAGQLERRSRIGIDSNLT